MIHINYRENQIMLELIDKEIKYIGIIEEKICIDNDKASIFYITK